jgi:hypothetical protein
MSKLPCLDKGAISAFSLVFLCLLVVEINFFGLLKQEPLGEDIVSVPCWFWRPDLSSIAAIDDDEDPEENCAL